MGAPGARVEGSKGPGPNAAPPNPWTEALDTRLPPAENTARNPAAAAPIAPAEVGKPPPPAAVPDGEATGADAKPGVGGLVKGTPRCMGALVGGSSAPAPGSGPARMVCEDTEEEAPPGPATPTPSPALGPVAEDALARTRKNCGASEVAEGAEAPALPAAAVADTPGEGRLGAAMPALTGAPACAAPVPAPGAPGAAGGVDATPRRCFASSSSCCCNRSRSCFCCRSCCCSLSRSCSWCRRARCSIWACCSSCCCLCCCCACCCSSCCRCSNCCCCSSCCSCRCCSCSCAWACAVPRGAARGGDAWCSGGRGGDGAGARGDAKAGDGSCGACSGATGWGGGTTEGRGGMGARGTCGDCTAAVTTLAGATCTGA